MALMDLSKVPELVLAPEGEYDMRCIMAKKAHSENTGRNGIMLKHEFVDEDTYEPMFETLWFGNNEADDEAGIPAYTGDAQEKSNLMWRMFQDRLKAFDMDSNGELEMSDLIEDFNLFEFTAYVEIEESEDYPAKNVIKKIT